MFKFLKQLFCAHVFVQSTMLRTFHDYLEYASGKKIPWVCIKCKKIEYHEEGTVPMSHVEIYH